VCEPVWHHVSSRSGVAMLHCEPVYFTLLCTNRLPLFLPTSDDKSSGTLGSSFVTDQNVSGSISGRSSSPLEVDKSFFCKFLEPASGRPGPGAWLSSKQIISLDADLL